MSKVPAGRLRIVNPAPPRPEADYVLYWMTAFRRLRSNFALEHAVAQARLFGKPLVILEALRCDYPWASDRLHQFIIQGMAEHATALARTPVHYVPYVEPARGAGRGLLEDLAARACIVIADDYPCFFLPRMVTAAAARLRVRVEAVDSNGVLPIRALTSTSVTAFSFRAYLQRTLREHLPHWPAELDLTDLPRWPAGQEPTPARWPATPVSDLREPGSWLSTLPLDHAVVPVAIKGGETAAAAALRRFVDEGLDRYVDQHSQPEVRGTSGLSPYLHFGHISSHDVFTAVMTHVRWTSRQLAPTSRGAREGWWGVTPGAEAFLDQVLTWRELGFNMCTTRPDDYASYATLPAWARATLERHGDDRREVLYTLDEFTNAQTHDVVWNAAQRQLTRDGWMHNYLRMLWGKKILEWTPSPTAALETMSAIMDRYALDGRDPNSYSGYGWTLGRYDRPWAPERDVYGTVRYMSSANTVRKLRLKRYLVKYGDGAAPGTFDF